MTSSVAGPRISSKALPKAKTAPKKAHGYRLVSAACPNQYSFLNSGKTNTSEKYAQKWMRCTENCKACSQHWSTERAQFLSTTMRNHTPHNQCFKSWINWAMKFCLIYHIHKTSCQLRTTSSSSLTTFCTENASTAQGRKCFPRVCWIPKDRFLCYRNKQTCFC